MFDLSSRGGESRGSNCEEELLRDIESDSLHESLLSQPRSLSAMKDRRR